MGSVSDKHDERKIAESRFSAAVSTRFLRYVSLVLLCCGVSAATLVAVYVLTSGAGADAPQISSTLHMVFLAMVVMIAIAVWPFVIVSEKGRDARKESDHKTERLLEEIKARQRTEREL